MIVETCTPPDALPPSCQVLSFATSEEASTVAQGIDGPTEPFMCVPDFGKGDLIFGDFIFSEGGSTVHVAANALLRFHTDDFPADHVPLRALLRARVLETNEIDENTGQVLADWYSWGPACELTDHADEGPADALAGVCGGVCSPASLPHGADVDFPLTNAAVNVATGGTSAIRVRMSPDGGGIGIANSSQPGTGPRLMVLACDELGPTPDEPPPGCEYYVAAAPLEASVAMTVTAETPPETFQCLASMPSLSTPTLVAADAYDVDQKGTVAANMLLRWDTSLLPEDMTIGGASLRMFVVEHTNEGDARIAGDWDAWGQCDVSDLTSAPQSSALSTSGACGTSCVLENIPQLTYVDLPLDDANNRIQRGPGAQTEMRVRLESATQTGFNALFASLSTTYLAGPGLVVLMCDTEPPPPADGARIAAWGLVNGEITVTGLAGSVEGGSQVTITNVRTGGQIIATANSDGSFAAPLGVAMRDALTIEVADAAGNSSPETTVLVLPPSPDLVAPAVDRTVSSNLFDDTGFIYGGPIALQLDVAPGTLTPERAAIVRGQVLDRDGEPIPGAEVSVLDRPEYGYTLSRSDGWFDLAVNGGETLTVRFEGIGTLPAQRQVDVPWQDYAFSPGVVLTEPDPQSTDVTLSSSAPQQVATGSLISDANGDRTGVVIFPAGVEAELVFPDGTTASAPNLNVRITEYSVGPRGPDAMPGELPATSAYTYAFELGADEAIAAGATRVELSQPVAFFVENFLSFPVGMAVPLGSYDRGAAAWMPEPNGRVLKVVSVTGGEANLDADGDGDSDPADQTILNTLGVSTAERQALGARYVAGQTLWRLTLTFFSAFDANWPGGVPNDAIPPNGGLPSGTGERERLDEPDTSSSGEIVFQNQALRQSAEVLGTPFSLTYESDRQLDRATLSSMTIPLSGASVPASLVRIELDVRVAGRRFEEHFPPLANQSTTFTWDGKDAYGRTLQGWQTVKVDVRFVYGRVYNQPAQSPEAFAETSGVALSGFFNTRAEIKSGVRFEGIVGGWDAKEEGLGGWSLDVHRSYDPVRRMLGGGDGAQRTGGQVEPVIESVAGGGSTFPIVDGVTKGTQLSLLEPWGIAIGSDGAVYFSDINATRRRIYRLAPNGTLSTIAGGGSSTADGVPATQARLDGARALALEGGFLYLAEFDSHRVRRIDLATGLITTAAGTGVRCTSTATACGDGGLATGARLSRPSGIDVAPDGTLYIAEEGDDGERVRKVSPDGIIRKIAGEGSSLANGIPATQASLSNSSMDVALGPEGDLYLSARTNRVRRVTVDGRIFSVAGNGTTGGTGDGLAPLQASLRVASGLAFDSEGGLFIVDQNDHRVRRVSPEGVITAVASMEGLGAGSTGDRGPAPAAKLNSPARAAVAPDGSLYVSQTVGGRVRRITSPLPGFAALGDIVIASRDGSEVYVFNSRGKHIRTIDALTNVQLWEFAYDSNGRLASVTDQDDNVTEIERDAAGNITAIVAPFGQQTEVTLDANGYLASLTNPAGETTSFNYSAKGLLTSITDPEEHTTDFTYDPNGRLTLREDAPDGSDTLTRVELANGYRVDHTTGEGVETGYQVEFLSTGEQRLTTFFPDGTTYISLLGIDGSETVTQRTAIARSTLKSPDPRFGMQAAIDQDATVTTPVDNLTATVTQSRTATLSDPNNPLSVTTHSETVNVNGRPVTRTYDAATRTYTDTSPAGRQTTTVLDADNRPIQQQVGNLTPTTFSYDASGRLTGVAQGSRSSTIAYDASGNVASVTDSANRTVQFAYDGAGRVTTQTLPDLRAISLAYDRKGNVTSITPPGRPAHGFAYSPTGLPLVYAPPNVTPPLAEPRTFYDYNLSGQLTRIHRPDGQTLFLDYDLLTGDLITQVWPGGQRNFNYDQDTGNLEQITYPGGSLTYTYDGSLLKTETWAGTVAGNVSRTYDSSFRVSTQRVNGLDPVTYTYDDDDLLISATLGSSTLTLTRSPETGLVMSSTLGVVTDTYGYNSFGEVTSYTASVSGLPIFSAAYTRDELGRISAKTETVDGATDTYAYTYDSAGRLTDVVKNGTPTAHYDYDANGNRIGGFNEVSGTLVSAIYDAQDRLLLLQTSLLGTQSWTYGEHGEVLTKSNASGTSTYTYDVLGNLQRLTLPSGDEVEYVVDGQDRRVGKNLGTAIPERRLYNGQLAIAAELDGNGTAIDRFIYVSKPNIPDFTIRNGIAYRVVSDHVGNPRLTINSMSGAVVQRTDFDEFGNIVFEDILPGFPKLPFGFAGGLHDLDAALVRFGARDFEPATGRWTAKDPIGFEGRSVNLYRYAQDDPINWIDLDGLTSTLNDLSQGQGLSLQLSAQITAAARTARTARGLSSIFARLNNLKYRSVGLQDLIAAAQEAAGGVVKLKRSGVPFDHITEVRLAQRALLRLIGDIKGGLANPGLRLAERALFAKALADASRLLDWMEHFLPR